MNSIKDFGRRLGVTLIDLLTSKKAIAAAVAAVVGHVVKDPTQRAEVIASIVAFIFSQGYVDHAKELATKDIGAVGVAALPVVVGESQPLPTAPRP